MQKIGEAHFEIEPSHCDNSGKASITHIYDLMQKIATKHANTNGFGYNDITSSNLAWVLSRFGIFVNRYPANEEKIKLITWVSAIDRFFTQRNFACFDADDNIIAKAVSFWAGIDIKTRRPTNLIDIQNGSLLQVLTQPEQDIVMPRLFKIPAVDTAPIKEYIPQYSDIDINRHFNSIKYVEHALNLYSADLLSGAFIESLEIVYLAEILPNMQIAFCKDGDIIDMKNLADGKSMCRMRLHFK